MARLLVSVRDAAEAADAIAGGAAIVDIKEPRNGSLGAASVDQWSEIIESCPGHVPLSIALGELTDSELPERLAAIPQVKFAKIGLAGCRLRGDWSPHWRWAIEQLPAGIAAVAVVYADADRAASPTPEVIATRARKFGCRGILWDTFDKTRGSLLAHIPLERLSRQVAEARQNGMLIVLAGSLTARDLPAVKQLAPNFVAVRGAVCSGPRTGHVKRELVEQVAQAVRDL